MIIIGRGKKCSGENTKNEKPVVSFTLHLYDFIRIELKVLNALYEEAVMVGINHKNNPDRRHLLWLQPIFEN